MKKKIFYISIILTIIIIVSEMYLRFYWGFCDTVLVIEDAKYEYIAQPNQNRFRFRHHIYYNSYSMRSPELNPKSLKILGLGDSVINGGTHTDQDSIATTLLSKELSEKLQRDVQVLNISYGSWGPDNVMAYINEFGNFNAGAAFLVVSSHDAYDNMDFQKIVDKNVSFPSKQSKSAIFELFDRYAIPRLFKKSKKNTLSELGINKREECFNTGFEQLYNYFKVHNIPFFIYLHPERREVRNQEYNQQGEQIIAFCKENNIPLIEGINYEDLSCFRDMIHLNEKGQRTLTNVIISELNNYIQ
ncbi:hypothetical protein FACS1894207_3860 [Bacteroidia bacterium]|nr:hypothetical protein FACS1894207_3860 [Bacteroidia bacterium]